MSLRTRHFLALFLSLTTASAFAAKAEKIVFDPKASTIKWQGKKVTGEHSGTVKLKHGEVTMNGTELTGGEFVMDMSSIEDTDITDAKNNQKLVGHLKSDDFFSVDKFPTSILKIKEAKSVEGFTGPTYEVTGDLTIKGKANEVKFPMMISTKNGKTTATASVTLDRTKWDVRYGSGKFFKGLGDKAIYDDFVLDVALATK